MSDTTTKKNYQRDNLKWNGWGSSGEDFTLGEREDAFWEWVKEELGSETIEYTPAVSLEDIALDDIALDDDVLEKLQEAVGEDALKTSKRERVFHSVGRSYRDLIRIRRGIVDWAPDVVVYPETSKAVADVLAICNHADIGVIPFGGGSSVVGGVEPVRSEGQNGVVTLDTTRLHRILAIDELSQTARVQAGVYGPDLEEGLQAKGFTLGHYPQSFEYSTLGGWIAARGAGQQSNGYGTAAKWLCGAEVVTPTGRVTTTTFPNSAAGPDLKHMIAGSEGTLGVITEATVRLHRVPPSQDYRAFLFRDFVAGCSAIRELMQHEIPVSMLRLSDADETRFLSEFSSVGKRQNPVQQVIDKALSATGYGENACMLMVGSEGDRTQVTWTVAQVTAACVRHGALPLGSSLGEKWYEGRFGMPFLREPLLDRGVGVETLETATSWNNIHHLHQVVGDAIEAAIEKTSGLEGMVMSHVSHSYHTGASLYFTFVFEMNREAPIAQWETIKSYASDTIVAHGGTISHHHGVGVDHLPWMKQEKGDGAIRILHAVRNQVDPKGIMNSGKTY